MMRPKGVIIVGEVGGEQEEQAAEFISTRMKKPVAAYIAGSLFSPGKAHGACGRHCARLGGNL